MKTILKRMTQIPKQKIGELFRLASAIQEKDRQKKENSDLFSIDELVQAGKEAGIDPIHTIEALRKLEEKEMQDRVQEQAMKRAMRFTAPIALGGLSLWLGMLANSTTPTARPIPYTDRVVYVQSPLPETVKGGLSGLSWLFGVGGVPAALVWAMGGNGENQSNSNNRKNKNSNRQFQEERTRQRPQRSTQERGAKQPPKKSDPDLDSEFRHSFKTTLPIVQSANQPESESAVFYPTQPTQNSNPESRIVTDHHTTTTTDTPSEPDTWLYDAALMFYGRQGSGKTSKAGYNAARHVAAGHRVIYINPIGRLLFWKGIESYGFPTTKAGDHPSSLILERIKDEKYQHAIKGLWLYIHEIERRMSLCGSGDFNPYLAQHLHLVTDEMTDWEAEIEARDSDVLRRLTVVTTQYLRQSNASVAFVTHGDTLACLGGSKATNGKSNVIRNTFKRVQCQATNDSSVPGGYTCAGFAKVFDPGEEFARKVLIPTGCEPPNKAYTPSGMSYYDFTPLFPSQSKNASASVDVMSTDVRGVSAVLDKNEQHDIDIQKHQNEGFNKSDESNTDEDLDDSDCDAWTPELEALARKQLEVLFNNQN